MRTQARRLRRHCPRLPCHSQPLRPLPPTPQGTEQKVRRLERAGSLGAWARPVGLPRPLPGPAPQLLLPRNTVFV